MPPVYHITEVTTWAEAQRVGHHAPPSLELEGFIHLSRPEQVVGTADLYYRGRADLVLLEIEASALGEALRFEAAANGRGVFPHLYAPLPVSAVRRVLPMPCRADGGFDDPTAPDR